MNSLLRWIGAGLIWTLNLIGWFIRYAILIAFALMVFSLFTGVIFYFGYEFGYMDGVEDAFELIGDTPKTLET